MAWIPQYNLNGANDRVYDYYQPRLTSQYVFSRGPWVAETRFGYNHQDMLRLDQFFTFKDPKTPEKIEWQRRVPRLSILEPEHLGGRRGLGYGRDDLQHRSEAQPSPGPPPFQVRRPVCAFRRQPDQPREPLIYFQYPGRPDGQHPRHGHYHVRLSRPALLAHVRVRLFRPG